MKKAFLNWSSGKDAAFVLHKVLQGKEYRIDKLFTTYNPYLERVSMHGVRKELLQLQAESLQLPLHLIPLEGNVSLEEYNRIMAKEITILKKEGFTHSIYGDIFLEDLRHYREAELNKLNMKAVFPLWKADTKNLINEILDAGFKMITVCVNEKLLDKSFCGRIIDKEFLKDLPEGIDPCGENGEFHTFVFDGPVLSNPVKFKIGETVQRHYTSTGKKDCFRDNTSWDSGFWFTDLLPD